MPSVAVRVSLTTAVLGPLPPPRRDHGVGLRIDFTSRIGCYTCYLFVQVLYCLQKQLLLIQLLATMSQPRKKRKTQADAEVPVAADLRQKTEDLVSKLGDTLSALDDSGQKQAPALLTDASLCFLELKGLQRRVLDQIHQSQQQLAQQRQKRDEQELQLANLKYQKVLNEQAIAISQNPETSNLVRLCRSELYEEADKETDDQALLQKFFNADTRDPVQRAVIVDKLNQQVRGRKKLETELKRYQQEASSLKQSLASKRKLLVSLPSKLQDMERASLPLQKFCQKSLDASVLLGTKRRTTLDLAHSLPKALYTLFYLLQSSLDSMETSGEMAAMKESSIMAPSLEVNNDFTCVSMNISIPNISDRTGTSTTSGFGTGKKMVVISFEYDEGSNTVTAASSVDHDMEKVVNELFPGDTGELEVDKSDESETEERAGRLYNWCNYLAGLHLPPSEQISQPNMHTSATVVIRALLRRVRAQATLSWILHALSRKPHPLPVHPALKDASFCQSKDSSVKLVSWAEQEPAPSTDEESSSSKDYFLATLKRRSSTLSLRVGIHTARYPSIVPTWELNPEHQRDEDSLDNDKTILYDDRLLNLERRINQDVEHLVLPKDETTYEWILSHQLSEIATKWEEQLIESDS
jgi:hypothetical protein